HEVDGDDVRALLGQPDGVAATLAAGGTGNERDFSFKTTRHGVSSPVACLLHCGAATSAPADGLGLGVLLEALDAVLPPDAAVLVAAVGRVGAVPEAAVDPDGAGADLVRDGHRAIARGGEHAPGQAVLAVVGDRDGVRVVVVADDRDHRAEDLLLRDRHRVVHVGEQRRLDVVALLQVGRAAAAEGQRGALGDAPVDVGLHAVALRGADH